MGSRQQMEQVEHSGSNRHIDYDSSEMYDVLALEALTFSLQDSSFCSRIYDFHREVSGLESHITAELYGILATDNPLLSIFHSFLNFLVSLNQHVEECLKESSELISSNRPNRSESFKNSVTLTIEAVVFPPDVFKTLDIFAKTYLCLRLEHSESQFPHSNPFSAILPSKPVSIKHELLDLGNRLNSIDCYICLENFYESLCVPFIKEAIANRIKTFCLRQFTDCVLKLALFYTDEIVRNCWCASLFARSKLARRLTKQLTDDLIYTTFYETRKEDIFSLILEFPESTPALEDFEQCLSKVAFRQDLIEYLAKQVKQRLIHPGVHTEQVLVVYSYLVRSLRIIDSSYLSQDVVCRPVCLCLRQREDAVRCIVNKLISTPDGDGEQKDNLADDDDLQGATTELHAELLLPKPLEVEPAGAADDSDIDMVFEDPPFDADRGCPPSEPGSIPLGTGYAPIPWGSNWQPDPVEALYQRGLWRRRLDLLSMLVSIYGSKKAFLVEYRQLLSQRLLKLKSFHTARELRNLELLKLRFGEGHMHECEVMLKDIRDSKRIASLIEELSPVREAEPRPTDDEVVSSSIEVSLANKTSEEEATSTKEGIQCTSPKPHPLSVFILSHEYWPELTEDHLKLPEELLTQFDEYRRSFERLKANRTLRWMHRLGVVNATVTLNNKTIELNMSPLQASIVYLFTKKRTWTVRNMTQELEVSAIDINCSLQAFINFGFIRKIPNEQQGDVGLSDSRLINVELVDETFEVCDGITHGSIIKSSNSATGNTTAYTSRPTAENLIADDPLLTSMHERKEKQLQQFYNYLVFRLTALRKLTLEEIFSLMQMFTLSSTSSVDCSKEELRQFLDKKVNDHQLAMDGTAYQTVQSDQ